MTKANKPMKSIIAAAALGIFAAGCGTEETKQQAKQETLFTGEAAQCVQPDDFSMGLASSNGNGDNRLTGATGPLGWLRTPWQASVKNFRPDIAEQHTPQEIDAMRLHMNPVLLDVTARFTEQNARYMDQHLVGRSPGESDLFLAHWFGSRGAVELLNNPDRPAVEVFSNLFNNETSASRFVGLEAAETGMSSHDFVARKVAVFEHYKP